MSKIVELYGSPTDATSDWPRLIAGQECPYLQRRCLKTRKSQPEITIGTCTVAAGKGLQSTMICPFRLLERRQIFTDCIHLLTLHQPGNELHIVAELGVPGGNIDYCLASVRGGKVVDFVGIELQTLDTTGTVWPERQRFLHQHGLRVKRSDRLSRKTFGLNWKMTAKTILVQLHHKVETFQSLSKHLVLVLQDQLLDYMKREFTFSHLEEARLGDPMHFHAYSLTRSEEGWRLGLADRLSTDSDGIAECLGLQADRHVAIEEILSQLDAKISNHTRLNLEPPPPATSLAIEAAEQDA